MREFGMPAMGADMESGVLLEWKVQPGEEVHKGDVIAVVDTDKSAIDVEVFHDGVVHQLLVEPGTEVPVGAVLALLAEPGEEPVSDDVADDVADEQLPDEPAGHEPSPDQPVADAPVRRPEPSAAAARRQMTEASRPAVVTSPLVRRLAAHEGVDLAARTGTGAGGAITRSDVEGWATGRPARRRRITPRARRLARTRGVDLDRVSTSGPVTSADLPDTQRRPKSAAERQQTMRGAIAAAMARSAREIPHYHLADTVDLASALQLLRDINAGRAVADRILPAALLLWAAARATAEVPELNGTMVDDVFRPSDTVDLGVAIALRGGGLVAPAIPDAASLTLDETMTALRELIMRSRSGRLRSSDMAGGSITVTSLGDQGVARVHGVIYPPQVALVGFGRIADRPAVVDGQVAVRPTVEITLAGDHRVSDGLHGSRFLRALAHHLSTPPAEPRPRG